MQHADFSTSMQHYLEYKQQSPFVQHSESYTLQQAMPESLRDLRVLDAACGFGYYTRTLAQRRPLSLVASDISSEAVAMAKHYNREFPEIQYRVQDCAEMTDEQQYDLILANFLLPFATSSEQLQRMCNRLFAALRPGGTVLGFLPNGDPQVDFGRDAMGRIINIMYEVPAQPTDGAEVQMLLLRQAQEIRIAMRWYNHSTYRRCLEVAGFDGSSGKLQFTRPQVSPAGLQKYGSSFWTSLVRQPVHWFLRATRAAAVVL